MPPERLDMPLMGEAPIVDENTPEMPSVTEPLSTAEPLDTRRVPEEHLQQQMDWEVVPALVSHEHAAIALNHDGEAHQLSDLQCSIDIPTTRSAIPTRMDHCR